MERQEEGMTVWKRIDDGAFSASIGDIFFRLEQSGLFWKLSCTENNSVGIFPSADEAMLYAEGIIPLEGA